MRTVKAMDYTLTVSDSGRKDEMGKSILIYQLVDPNGEELFNGADFHCSPMHAPESDETLRDLLGFLTVRKGDTDANYFDMYTEGQLAFAASADCEQLQAWVDERDGYPFD